jgi:hypothetical protein
MATLTGKLSTILWDRGPVLASVIAILFGVLVFSQFFSSNMTKFPLVGSEYSNSEQRRKAYLTNARSLYKKGYETFKNQAFRLTTADGTLHMYH